MRARSRRGGRPRLVVSIATTDRTQDSSRTNDLVPRLGKPSEAFQSVRSMGHKYKISIKSASACRLDAHQARSVRVVAGTGAFAARCGD